MKPRIHTKEYGFEDLQNIAVSHQQYGTILVVFFAFLHEFGGAIDHGVDAVIVEWVGFGEDSAFLFVCLFVWVVLVLLVVFVCVCFVVLFVVFVL